MITPPAGGTLLTDVEDQTGAPLSGVVGERDRAAPTRRRRRPTRAGCAIFSGLDPGDYTLALTDAGYVDQDDDPANPLDISATVTSTGTATPSGGNPIILGLAGTFNAPTSPRHSGSAMTGQQADAVSWYGAGTSDSMSIYKNQGYGATTPPTVPCTSASSPCSAGATIPSTGSITLFPFEFTGPSYTSNYSVWAGACRQEQPPTGRTTSPSRPGPARPWPSRSRLLDVVVNYNGARVAPAHVKIRPSPAAPAPRARDNWGRRDRGQRGDQPTGVLASPGQPFASTATSGVDGERVWLHRHAGGLRRLQQPQGDSANLQNTNFAPRHRRRSTSPTRRPQGTC